MTSPDCVSAGLGIDVIEAEEVPNVRDLFEAWYANGGEWPESVRRTSNGNYKWKAVATEWQAFQAGYRAAGGQGA